MTRNCSSATCTTRWSRPSGAPSRRTWLACGECRTELKALRGTARSLAAWAPPEPELRLPDRPRAGGAAAARRWSSRRPGARRCSGARARGGLARSPTSRSGTAADGLTVRTGWRARAGRRRQASPAVAAMRQRRRALRGAAADDQPAPARPRVIRRDAAGDDVDARRDGDCRGADVLRQVRQLLADSENRQQRELALRIGQVLRDVEGARRVDFDRIQRALPRSRASRTPRSSISAKWRTHLPRRAAAAEVDRRWPVIDRIFRGVIVKRGILWRAVAPMLAAARHGRGRRCGRPTCSGAGIRFS